jgi:acetyl-CoA carboxylase carboxyltransferase component
MNRLFSAMFGMAVATLCSLPASAADREQVSSPDEQQRELIYCADLMTHEEREAYRASMRTARSQQEKAALRQAHQEEMRARARERGLDPIECEPQRQRERLRLRLRGGAP